MSNKIKANIAYLLLTVSLKISTFLTVRVFGPLESCLINRLVKYSKGKRT